MNKTQVKVQNFIHENNLHASLEHRTLDLVSEVGELSKEILKMTQYGKSELILNDEYKMEMGDVYFSLIALANMHNIDLEEALESVLKKYHKRLQKGSAGSEVE